MKAIDFTNMSDEEFAKMFKEFDNKMDKFLEQDDFFNRFVAYFIAEEYKQELLPTDSFEVIIRTAIDTLSVIQTDKDKIKSYLKDKYNLEVTNEDNLKLKEL